MQVRHRRPPRFGRPRPLQASRPRYQRPCRYEGSDRGRPFASFVADDVAGPDARPHPNTMICVGRNRHDAVQLRGSSRLGDGSVGLECDRSCVVTRRANFSFDRCGAAAMIALFAVGFLAACGGGNGSAGGTLTSGGTRTTPTRSTPTVTAPTRSTPTVTAPTRSTPTVTAPTRSTPTVTESQTTTVVAVTPPPVTTTTSGATTTSGVSPAAVAAAAAASQNDDESSSTQWGWIAFAILAAAVLIGGIVWWWRRHSAQARTKTPGPGDPPEESSSALPG